MSIRKSPAPQDFATYMWKADHSAFSEQEAVDVLKSLSENTRVPHKSFHDIVGKKLVIRQDTDHDHQKVNSADFLA